MKSKSLVAYWVACLTVVGWTVTVCADALHPSDWPQFRGWRASGVADGQDLPSEWDIESFHNIRWRSPIPGLGLASPVIAGQRLFLVTVVGEATDPSLRVGLYGDIASVADEGKQSWQLYCLDKRSGQVLWIRELHHGEPTIKRHTKASHANSTPATDGKHVVVNLGAEGLYCYDIYGSLVWKKDLGQLDSGYYMLPQAQWGFASSPIIYEDRVFIQCDVQEDSFVAALDIHSGDEIWRTPREDVPGWSTPAIHKGARTQLILNGYGHSGGYDLRTGKELWRLGGGGDIPVPTPVIAGDLIIFSSAHGIFRPLRAVQANAEGEIKLSGPRATGEFIAWTNPRDGIYMQTPLIYRDLVYACQDSGVLSCYHLDSGQRIYRKRLGGSGGFTASAVASDDKVYFTGEEGDIYVVRAGEEFSLLAKNRMDDICMATPAISDGMLFVRTKNHVYAIGKPTHEQQLAQTEVRSEATSQRTQGVRCYPASCRKRRLQICGWRH